MPKTDRLYICSQKINNINNTISVFRSQKLSLGSFLLSESLAIRNVAQAQILLLMPYVGWVCCWFSPLLREVFLRVLLKNQHFHISSRSRTYGDV